MSAGWGPDLGTECLGICDINNLYRNNLLYRDNLQFIENKVDTRDAVAKLIDDIVNATTISIIFVDLEGINLSRHGSISIMQLSS